MHACGVVMARGLTTRGGSCALACMHGCMHVLRYEQRKDAAIAEQAHLWRKSKEPGVASSDIGAKLRSRACQERLRPQHAYAHACAMLLSTTCGLLRWHRAPALTRVSRRRSTACSVSLHACARRSSARLSPPAPSAFSPASVSAQRPPWHKQQREIAVDVISHVTRMPCMQAAPVCPCRAREWQDPALRDAGPRMHTSTCRDARRRTV
jgi:hypothetical protein